MSIPNTRADPLRILTVCTHNRTRSVMSMAMIQAQLDARLGPDTATVGSAGFGPEGVPAISDAVDALRRRGLEVGAHRSRQVSGQLVDDADLILTAEKDHVVRIVGASPAAFAKTFTLPEFCDLSETVGDAASFRDWVGSLSVARRPIEYLDREIPEIADPTGFPPRRFDAATVAIEALCTRAVDAITRAVDP
jgi:protein-tyrosine-phosphatase